METNQNEILTQAVSQQQEQIDQFTNNIQSQVMTYLPLMLLFSGLVLVGVLLNLIHKWRLERAILRIDKNIQKLVEQSDRVPSSSSQSES